MTKKQIGKQGSRKVLVLINPARFWRWQKWVIDALSLEMGFEVELRLSGNAAPLPMSLRLLFVLESVLYGKTPARACKVLSVDMIMASQRPVLDKTGDHDLVIDFSDADEAPDDLETLTPVFDGVRGEMGAVSALLSHRLPEMGILQGANYQVLGLSASEEPLVLTQGLDQAFSRMTELFLQFIRDGFNAGTGKIPHGGKTGFCGLSARFALSSLSAKINSRLKLLSTDPPRWAIGWRRVKNDAGYETLRISPDDFVRFCDDGERYFADPFVFVHEGKTYVFCEELPYSTGCGLISVFTIGEDGRCSAARPVLERPYHLSYPFVFAHEGEIWMIPESSSNRSVELYRAASFPDEWVLERELLTDVLADDATLLMHDNRLWLFAATRAYNSSSWDTLSLFSSTDLMGDWRAHDANPVLCDARCARPGGAIFTRDGALWRPAQDCTKGYGSGLALARITQLDDAGFAQGDVRYLSPAGRRDLKGMHTLNAAGGIEVIDMFGTF